MYKFCFVFFKENFETDTFLLEAFPEQMVPVFLAEDRGLN